MAIVYALVARGTVVLAEFAAVSGNAGAVARRILEKLPPDADSSLCFAQDRYIFHVLRDQAGITFLCMANDTFGSMHASRSFALSSMYVCMLWATNHWNSLPHTPISLLLTGDTANAIYLLLLAKIFVKKYSTKFTKLLFGNSSPV